MKTRLPTLWETLTGEVADPKAQLKAAIAFAQDKHAKSVNHQVALRNMVNGELAR
jgi:hypothetical protein